MTRQRNLKTAAILVLTALPLAGGVVRGREPKEPVFKYAGGTEDIASDCHGRVQLSAEALSFRCAQRTVEVPYATIVLMQYRPDVAPKVRGMNLNVSTGVGFAALFFSKAKPPNGSAVLNNDKETAVLDKEKDKEKPKPVPKVDPWKAVNLVKKIAGSSHEVVIHDMQKSEVASKARERGVRSVPAVVIDGKLAGCCAGRGPDEHVLRSALA